MDLCRGWIDFPRPKTGIERSCPLWPETADALRAAIATRPEPTDHDAAKLVFVTLRGKAWRPNTLGIRVRDLMQSAGIHRPRIGFYTLRHCFETVAGGARDQVAVDRIMGHVDGSMAANYRQDIDGSRLSAVAEHVRTWLCPPAPGDDGSDDAEQGEAGEAPQRKTSGSERGDDRLRLRIVG